MRKNLILAAALLSGLTACAANDQHTADALKFQHWYLTSIDGQAVATDNTYVGFIDALQLNGHTGCNDFFASTAVEEQRLQVSGLGMTYRVCEGEAQSNEQALLSTLKSSPLLQMENETLTLTGTHTLTFILGAAPNQ
ncbi:META domain-containing protein [Pseudoalteromonas sp. T1lg75]|uniref:META domain-containing protein n=1 Tax=Pseudoalteromonas sp. T1lg75 TaxID=2077102 RepID=UPI00131A4170|nr:META domain-containing protein [Pseudoalteromonas sp. T1lg75]